MSKVNDVLADTKKVELEEKKTQMPSKEEVEAKMGTVAELSKKAQALSGNDAPTVDLPQLDEVLEKPNEIPVTKEKPEQKPEQPAEEKNFISSSQIKHNNGIKVNMDVNNSMPKPSFMPNKFKPEIKYPVYTVVTPQSRDTYLIRTMTVADSLKLKGSFVTPEGITKVVAEVLWDCIVEAPSHIKSYDDFITNLTSHDRQALLFGLYHITEGEIISYPIECSGCGKSYEMNFPTAGLAKIKAYEGDQPLLKKKVIVPLPISNANAIIKQNTVADEFKSIKLSTQLPNDKDAIEELLYIDSFIFGDNKITDTIDKLDILKMLPKRDKRELVKAYNKEFGAYTIDLESEASCPFCGAKTTLSIDFMQLFFRLVS